MVSLFQIVFEVVRTEIEKCNFISISLDMEFIHTINDSLTWAAVGTAEFDDNPRVEEAEESQN